MKIKIKSREEIEKTLDKSGRHIDGGEACFYPTMFKLCGEILEAIDAYHSIYDKFTAKSGWHWHYDWYEVMEEDFTKEDLMDIEFMDEMLGYFIGENK